MLFKSYEIISNCIFNNLYKIPENIDLIVGIDRSGMIIALMIANYLHKKVVSFDEFIDDNFNIDNIKNVLITQDSTANGKRINEIKNQIKLSNKFYLNIKYIIIYYVNKNILNDINNIALEHFQSSDLMELNFIFNQFNLTMYQIQGNLCRKPTQEEIQNQEKYLDYINNVKPYQRPNKQIISCIITNRPEKYRKQTQEWLKKYNYRYNKLIMMPQNINDKIKYKGQIYKNSSEELYISNDEKESIEINKISNKQVLCTQTMQIIQ